MANEKRTIPYDVYLQALGLFTLGNSHYTKGRECENMANALLGLEDGSDLSDKLFETGAGPAEFDRALELSDIVVELPTPSVV